MYGNVSELVKETVLKTVCPKGLVGSNPTVTVLEPWRKGIAADC